MHINAETGFSDASLGFRLESQRVGREDYLTIQYVLSL